MLNVFLRILEFVYPIFLDPISITDSGFQFESVVLLPFQKIL